MSVPAESHFKPAPQKAVLVLMYHQVTNTPLGLEKGKGHYGPAITAAQFDADLMYLHRRGFMPVDPLLGLGYLTGHAAANKIPGHAYLITFDDGFRSAWTDATPILRRYRVKAMMFVEGARTDKTPGRITSDDIRAMARSGVWELQSHGYAGHSNLQIGPGASEWTPYWYANLAWLPAAHRLETADEFEARLVADLRESRTTLARLSGEPVTVFAYPSGEFGQNIALPAGADDSTISAQGGHSNAPGLTQLIDEALRKAGYDAAFAVTLPGSELAASPADGPFHFPRIGESPQKYTPDIATIAEGELKLPAVSPEYHWLDCKPVAVVGDRLMVASAAEPFVYSLDAASGRVNQVLHIPELAQGRSGQPTLTVGLVPDGNGGFIAYQQKGWWDGGYPRLIYFRIEGAKPVVTQTLTLADDADWFVGLARADQRLIGMSEEGEFSEIAGTTSRPLFSVPNDAPHWKQADVGRFAGLAYADGLLYAFDRKNKALLGIDPTSGTIKERTKLPGDLDVRSIGGDDRELWLVNYAGDRRTLYRMRSALAAPR